MIVWKEQEPEAELSVKTWFPLHGKRHDHDTKTKRL